MYIIRLKICHIIFKLIQENILKAKSDYSNLINDATEKFQNNEINNTSNPIDEFFE